jgi:hypothetical protein
MNNLTHQHNYHVGSTHAVNHHRFRMIGRLQTLSNPTTPSPWIPMSMVCSNCGRICRTVGVICSKRKNWLFWWLKFYTYFTYIGKWQQPRPLPWRANMGEIYVLRVLVVLMFMNARLGFIHSRIEFCRSFTKKGSTVLVSPKSSIIAGTTP